LAWTLDLPGNHLTLPSLGLVAGVASMVGVPVSMAMAEVASRDRRRPVIISICLVSVDVLGIGGVGRGVGLGRVALSGLCGNHKLCRCRRTCRRSGRGC